jgi:anion-transporting  ArsA/GET3 family ATPase
MARVILYTGKGGVGKTTRELLLDFCSLVDTAVVSLEQKEKRRKTKIEVE